MPIAINGSGTLTGLSVGGLENGIITPAELSTGAPSWDAQYNLTNIASINNGPLAGFRNAIINGNFDLWQRGTSFESLASGEYHADRWRVIFNGGGTRTLSRQLFTLGQTDVPGEPTYFIKWNQTVAGSGQTSHDLRQKVESVRTFAGQQVTFSFYAKAASAATLPAIIFSEQFGSGGSPSSDVNQTVATSIVLTTSWQRFSYTVTLPSITGKTLGSDGNDSIDFTIRMPFNVTFNIDIAQVQIEPGPVATTFEQRPAGMELALCQRYYEKTYNISTNPGTVTMNGVRLCQGTMDTAGNFQQYLPYKVEKRAVPSITLNSNDGTLGQWTSAGTGITSGNKAVIAANIGTSSFYVVVSTGGTGFSGCQCYGHFVASAEL